MPGRSVSSGAAFADQHYLYNTARFPGEGGCLLPGSSLTMPQGLFQQVIGLWSYPVDHLRPELQPHRPRARTMALRKKVQGAMLGDQADGAAESADCRKV